MRPVGRQPLVWSTAFAMSVTNTRVSCGVEVAVGISWFVELASDTNAARLPSGEIAMSTASTSPARTGPVLTEPSPATVLTVV